MISQDWKVSFLIMASENPVLVWVSESKAKEKSTQVGSLFRKKSTSTRIGKIQVQKRKRKKASPRLLC